MCKAWSPKKNHMGSPRAVTTGRKNVNEMEDGRHYNYLALYIYIYVYYILYTYYKYSKAFSWFWPCSTRLAQRETAALQSPTCSAFLGKPRTRRGRRSFRPRQANRFSRPRMRHLTVPLVTHWSIEHHWNAYQGVTRKTRTQPHCKVYETVPITGWSNILCRRTLFCRRSRPSSKAIPQFRDLGPHLFGVRYALAFCDSCNFGKLNIQRRNESVHPFSSLRFTTKIDLKSDHWLQNLS